MSLFTGCGAQLVPQKLQDLNALLDSPIQTFSAAMTDEDDLNADFGETQIAGGANVTARVEQTEDGAKITITDDGGTTTAIVRNGKDGKDAVLETDDTLTLEDGVLRVNTAKDVEQDNTLPVTSAAVFVEIGNIDALLQTI